MNRRNFLSLLAASLTLDPERLLWTPGKKLISIPKPKPPMIGETKLDSGAYIQEPFIYVWNSAHTKTYKWPVVGSNNTFHVNFELLDAWGRPVKKA